MKTSTALGIAFGAIVLVVALLFFEAALLGIIPSWFNVSLTI
jgi:threonine/homoserine/homoserine lactone efflux protein